MNVQTKWLPSGLLLLFLQLSACAIPPTNPALINANLAPLIPVRNFVANTDFNDNYQVSPDGSKLVYQGVSRLKPAILWRTIEGNGKTQALRFRKGPPYPFWSADGRYILFVDDPSGREQHHVFAIDTRKPEIAPRDLTPYEGISAYVHHVPGDSGSKIFVSHNRRDRAVFDIYSIDLDTGEESPVMENTQNIINTLLDDDGVAIARVRQTDTNRILEIRRGEQWLQSLVADQFDWMNPLGLNQDSTGLYLTSNVGRNKAVLVLMDIESGQQTVLYEHPTVDVQGVHMSKRQKRPLAVYIEPDYPEIHFLDEKLKNKLTPFLLPEENGVSVMSIDNEERMATLVIYDESGATYKLVDLQSGEASVLGEGSSRKHANTWVEKQPFSFSASDGMQLHGYVSVPKNAQGKPLPTVLLVHGGPWARDGWGHQSEVQFLANRGYAVLQVNYRGSTGYGRDYLFAAVGEFAGKMHSDLIDAVDWAVAQGITDANKVAIVGGSYGGYATLVGMTMTPERFQCGISYVGVSDLTILLDTAPPYWKPFLPWWEHFIGDAQNPAQRKVLESKSPVNFAENVQKPLLILHGANDPRVVIEHSDKMAAALDAADKQYEYIVIDDEGHGFSHWKHQMTRYRKTEDFLATCLGGRSAGLDFYQLGSWMF